jgi:hypothetical protein
MAVGTLALKKHLVLNASWRCLLGTLRGKKTWDINKRLDPFWIEVGSWPPPPVLPMDSILKQETAAMRDFDPADVRLGH